MFRWLVNFGLLVLPIAVTLGVLLGIQSHRTATGQPGLFVDSTVKIIHKCDKTVGITPESKGLQYTLNPNQWGWDESDGGGLCMDVTQFNNRTYATKTTAPEFSVTWQYPQGPETAPVHAFPNIKVDSDTLPLSLGKLGSLELDIAWTYGVGNDSATSTDEQALTDNETNANVAIDMFLDSDSDKATDPTKAGIEVMVWLATFGPATQPLGFGTVLSNKTIEDVTFDLYNAKNENEQNVFTWVARATTEKFSGDISPLVATLLEMAKDGYPTSSDYLGYMGLGSEALYAKSNVTFHVPKLSMDIEKSKSA